MREIQPHAGGDPNDCKARVDAISTTGKVIAPGADINAVRASNSVVILYGGTYNLTMQIQVSGEQEADRRGRPDRVHQREACGPRRATGQCRA